MKTIGKIAAVTAGLSASALFAGGWFTMEQAMHGRRQTREEAYSWQKNSYDVSFYDPLEKTDYIVESFDGYELHAQSVMNPAGTDRYMILTHGYTDNRIGMLKYMKIYMDLGFHCVIYDIRDHGENERSFCTYSLRESRDLIAVIHDTYERFGKEIRIGLHGESLGAATTIRSLMYHPEVEFAVADCGFADIENVLIGAVSSQHLPKAAVKIASVLAKLKYGYSFSEMRPIDALAGNEIPILFIHGAEDTFILPSNSERMKEATGGYAKLQLIPGAKHANSVLKNPEMYAACIKEFLRDIEKPGLESAGTR